MPMYCPLSEYLVAKMMMPPAIHANMSVKETNNQTFTLPVTPSEKMLADLRSCSDTRFILLFMRKKNQVSLKKRDEEIREKTRKREERRKGTGRWSK
jgi:hypothetical protein